MMGASVYLSDVVLYASPKKTSKTKGILTGSHPPSNENSSLFL